MSSMKLCDRHGGPFPAGSEGSSKVNAVIYRKYDTGEKYEERTDWDFCPDCTKLMESPKVGEADFAKINQMERELGMAPSPPTPLPDADGLK